MIGVPHPARGWWFPTRIRVAFLIIEDDPAVGDALQALLMGAGHSAVVFRSAEGFLAAGPPQGTDTVVVDLGLPGISGSALLRWLAALADPPRLIVISGKSSVTIQRETQELRAPLHVLRKPPAADWLTAIAG